MLSEMEISRIDRSSLYKIYEDWPRYCKIGMNLPTKLPVNWDDQIQDVIYVGMGSSGLCGEILVDWVKPFWKVPLYVVKDFYLPAFASPKTFLIIASPTGYTAETISSLVEGIKEHCKIAVIAGGGTVEQICKLHKIALTKIEMLVVSRATLPFVFYPSVNLLIKAKLIKKEESSLSESIKTIEELSSKISVSTPVDDNPAKQLAIWLKGGFPMIYGWGLTRSAALRFRQDLNENAKAHALSDELPEFGHNAMTAWEGRPNLQLKPIFLRSPNEPENIRHRFTKIKELIESSGIEVYEIEPIDSTPLVNTLGIIYMLDYASIYLAVLNKIDPTPMPSQEKLRQDLLKKIKRSSFHEF